MNENVNSREEYYSIPDCKPHNYTEEEKEQIRQFCESIGVDPRKVRGYDDKGELEE